MGMHIRSGFFLISLAVAVMGFGCGSPLTPSSLQNTASSTSSDFTPVSLEGLNPHDASKKIIFTTGATITMHQAFTGAGISLADSIGLGPTVDQTLVIRRFAPRNLSEMEWKATTKKQGTQYQFVGKIADANLRDSHSLYPFVYWKEGDSTALRTGLLWLSQDVYEDLAKIHLSTLKYGHEDGESLSFASSSPALRQSIRNLQTEITKIIDRTDVFATTATVGTRSLIVNGKESTVEVLIAKNWFGEIQILNNPDNPLVLSMRMNRAGGIDFGGLFDYTITELKDVKQ